MGTYVVLARRMGWSTVPVVVLIVLNLVYGFVVPGVGWQAPVRGTVHRRRRRGGRIEPRSGRLARVGCSSAVAWCVGMLAILAVLVEIPLSATA